MKVLWFTNCPMPDVVEHLGLPKSMAGHWMSTLLDALNERDDVELGVVTAYPGLKTFEHSANGIEYYVIGQRRFKSIFACDPKDLRACVDAANKFQPDVIHVHGSERFYGLLGARSLVQTPVLISIQGLLQPYAPEHFGALSTRELLRAETFKEVLTHRGLLWSYQQLMMGARQEGEILRGAGAVAGRTFWDESWARALAPRARYFHMDEVLRPAFFENNWQTDSYDPHSIIFTNIGTPRRGTEILLSALQILKAEFPKARLRLVGSSGRKHGRQSGYERFLVKRAQELGLDSSIEWLGQLGEDAMVRELCRSHVFAICSYAENSPNSLCEAMSLGVPCVASYAGGIPSLVEDGRTGLLFPKGDAGVLAANIRRLFIDRDLCARLSAESRMTARMRHAPERVVTQAMTAYRALARSTVDFSMANEERTQGVL